MKTTSGLSISKCKTGNPKKSKSKLKHPIEEREERREKREKREKRREKREERREKRVTVKGEGKVERNGITTTPARSPQQKVNI